MSLNGPWESRRTIWPYPDGYGVYNVKTKTVLDTGLATRAEADAICDELNEELRMKKKVKP